MKKLLGKNFFRSLRTLKQPLSQRPKELITASSVAVCILLLRCFGLLQSLELAAFDKFFAIRPVEPPEERITIVEIDEASLRQIGSWPIPDAVIAKSLRKLQDHKPRAVGLDIYRDLPVGSGHKDLLSVYKSMPNLVGIQLLSNNRNARVSPPEILAQHNQVGFNNVLLDTDGKVRRSLLYWHINNQAYESFGLKLALLYLQPKEITPKTARLHPDSFRLGKAVFQRLQTHDGGYVGVDNRGYQIVSNFPKPGCSKSSIACSSFRKISLRDVLQGEIPENVIRDRIVLIGSTAPSLQDFVQIPYSSKLLATAKPIAGVELQAYFISELISAATDDRPLIKVWVESFEWLWIFAWACIGSTTRSYIQNTLRSTFCLLFLSCLLIGSAYIGFLQGWWIPLVPSILCLYGSTIALTYQISYKQEESKRSKEFLYQVINTIADPIFVKNEKHQWIVLNDAYCQFIGYPQELLNEKFDYDFFPMQEAEVFRTNDEIVFKSQLPLETEEQFTNAFGKTHLISTKRSLHKDAAGNLFLVGVIRDITQRKLKEEYLKQAAAELSRSNQELKLNEDRLRFLAYHDPLTGLGNRKSFSEQLHESLEWAKKNSLLLGLLFIDLDGFKQVNDTLGHEMGDRLLVTVAERMSSCLSTNDTVFRLGGDEFTVILRLIANEQAVAKIADKILASLSEPILLDENIAKVSGSIGVSIYPLDSLDCENLVKKADAAMYRAKQQGKNRYEFLRL